MVCALPFRPRYSLAPRVFEIRTTQGLSTNPALVLSRTCTPPQWLALTIVERGVEPASALQGMSWSLAGSAALRPRVLTNVESSPHGFTPSFRVSGEGSSASLVQRSRPAVQRLPGFPALSAPAAW
jgi:hypothetical protein